MSKCGLYLLYLEFIELAESNVLKNNFGKFLAIISSKAFLYPSVLQIG